MNIVPASDYSPTVAAELAALGPRHALARSTYHSPADVYRVPAWYGSARPCAEPAASERWERVEVDATASPALAAWLAEDERTT